MLFAIKNLLFIYFNFLQAKIFENYYIELSNRFFLNYLNQDYIFFKKKNIAEVLRNLRTEIGNVVLYCRSFSGLLSEFLLAFGLIFLLLVHATEITFLAISISTLALIFYHFVSSKTIINLGMERLNLDFKINKSIIQGTNSIKEIKLFSKENIFCLELYKHLKNNKKINIAMLLINLLPRRILEIFIVVTICFLLLWLLDKNIGSAKVFSILGLFSIVSIRFIPSATKILELLQQIKFRYPSLELIHCELKNNKYNGVLRKKTRQKNKINFTNNISIAINDVSFAYLNKKIIDNLNINIKSGDIVGIFGKSGVGKSTLVDLLSGLLIPQTGEIKFNNKNIHSIISDYQGMIGYVSQKTYLLDENIEKNVSFELEENLIDKAIVAKALATSGLAEFVGSLELKEKTIVGDNGSFLSGGQIQRLGIARALYRNPHIIILDEATNALDKNSEKRIINNILSNLGNKVLFIISHDDELIKLCNKKIHLK